MMRGKILREPSEAAPGLLMVNGEQHNFVLERIWHSAAAPAIGSTVEVEMSPGGEIAGITAVPESQLAKEQAEAALQIAKEKGSALASGLIARFGVSTLAAIGVLGVSWFFLTAVSYNAGFLGKMEFTLWRVLSLINASSPMDSLRNLSGDGGSTGIYGLLGVVALAGPLAGYFWKDKRAELGGLLPLLFMIFVGLVVRQALGSIGGGFGSAREMQEIRDEMMKGVSIGLGTYLSLAAALYLAFKSTTKFLAPQK